MKGKRKRGGLSPLAAMENSQSLSQRAIHPAGAAAVLPEEEKEIAGVRISACVGIKYPFTEEGKPACLSRACPKNKECKICCKDWRKE